MSTTELAIINSEVIEAIQSHITRDGDQIVISAEAAQALRRFKAAQKMLDETEKQLKDILGTAMEAFNASTVRGDHITISRGAPRADSRFKLQDGYKHEWGKQRVSYVVDVDKIEAYMQLHGATPEGVDLQEAKQTITIRIKD